MCGFSTYGECWRGYIENLEEKGTPCLYPLPKVFLSNNIVGEKFLGKIFPTKTMILKADILLSLNNYDYERLLL